MKVLSIIGIIWMSFSLFFLIDSYENDFESAASWGITGLVFALPYAIFGLIFSIQSSGNRKKMLQIPHEYQEDEMKAKSSEEISNVKVSIPDKTNVFALAAAGLAAVSTFLPWVNLSSSSSFMGYSANFSVGGISGIQIGDGVIGLILSLVGAAFAFNKSKWSLIPGIINFFIGIGYLVGWMSLGSNLSYDFEGASAKTNVDSAVGLYLFVVASFAFVIFTLKYFNIQNKSTKSDFQ